MNYLIYNLYFLLFIYSSVLSVVKKSDYKFGINWLWQKLHVPNGCLRLKNIFVVEYRIFYKRRVR